MKNIKVLIVEDELLIAETLKLYIQERGHSVVGIAISFDEAIELLKNKQPDILLLDIRLYGAKSGIDLAKELSKLGHNIPYIVVSSQYDTKVIEDAMFAGATGYLTKPITKETLWSSLELAMMKFEKDVAAGAYIDLKSGHETIRVKLSDILYIKSAHVYVELICETTRHICRYNLSEMLELLNKETFVRCSRSYIINIDKIEKFSTTKVRINGEDIPIGAKYKNDVKNAIEHINPVLVAS